MIDIEIEAEDVHSDTDTDRSSSPVLPERQFLFCHLGLVPE